MSPLASDQIAALGFEQVVRTPSGSARDERLTYLAGLLETTEDAIVAMDERYLLTAWRAGAGRLSGWGRTRSWVGTPTRWLGRT